MSLNSTVNDIQVDFVWYGSPFQIKPIWFGFLWREAPFQKGTQVILFGVGGGGGELSIPDDV